MQPKSEHSWSRYFPFFVTSEGLSCPNGEERYLNFTHPYDSMGLTGGSLGSSAFNAVFGLPQSQVWWAGPELALQNGWLPHGPAVSPGEHAEPLGLRARKKFRFRLFSGANRFKSPFNLLSVLTPIKEKKQQKATKPVVRMFPILLLSLSAHSSKGGFAIRMVFCRLCLLNIFVVSPSPL